MLFARGSFAALGVERVHRNMNETSAEIPGADELCAQCGHPFNPHRLLGYGSPPTEGWMECPVEGCTCHMTWSLQPEAAAQIKAQKPGGK